MHEVAESGACALAHLVLATTRLPEVSHGREFRVDRSSAEPAVVQVLGRLVRVLLAPELDVDVAHEMVAQVVAHIHLLYLAVLVLQLDKDVLEEVVVVLLHLLVRYVGDHWKRGLGLVMAIRLRE